MNGTKVKGTDKHFLESVGGEIEETKSIPRATEVYIFATDEHDIGRSERVAKEMSIPGISMLRRKDEIVIAILTRQLK